MAIGAFTVLKGAATTYKIFNIGSAVAMVPVDGGATLIYQGVLLALDNPEMLIHAADSLASFVLANPDAAIKIGEYLATGQAEGIITKALSLFPADLQNKIFEKLVRGYDQDDKYNPLNMLLKKAGIRT